MKNLEYLTEESVKIIRQYQFDLDEDDNTRDDEINEMTKEDIASSLIGWEIGSESWLDYFIGVCAEVSGKDEDEIKEFLF